ncbi:MAG: DNA-binding response regulator [Lutibacter sp.]|nr:MAG: DNA-binding response regulator [Lutibacter sp.]
MKKYTVVIVEDHLLLSQAIGNIVDSFDDFEVISLFNNGKELTEKIATLDKIPDVILMDINMPIMNGIETTEWLTKHHPNAKVLALSVEDDEDTVLRMLRAGAKGYLLKDVEKSILEYALLEVIKNGFYYTKDVTDILMNSLSKEQKSVELKEKELIFIRHACTEMTYREIAGKMFLSPKTIDGYRQVLFEKLNVKNRIGLAMYAIRNNIYIP